LMSRYTGAIDAPELDLFGSLGQKLGLFIERVRTRAALLASEERLRLANAELEHRVEIRTAELAASNRDLEAFSYSVSHDLRAPLRAINGFAEILLDDHAAALPVDARRLLTTIRNSGRRLGTLIDDLLELARLGRTALRAQPIDVDRLVHELADELTRDLGDRRVELVIAPLAGCRADPSLLRQVWINLIDNALKYTRGRDPAQIEIFSEGAGDAIAYRVRDNGVGFDMQYADRLFGVFQRLHSDTEFEGTGVGLAHVHRILERHGGRVWADSELGQGSTFSFTLGPASAA